MDFIIFGAQGIALCAYQAFYNLYPKRKMRCFLVSDPEKNAPVLGGIPVIGLTAFGKELSQEEKDNTEILIATPENVMSDIENDLELFGFYNHIRLTSSRWAKLMGFHYACNKKFIPLSVLPIGCHKPEISIFMAKFYRDRPLTEVYVKPKWVIPIQVGASLCEERVAEILDCNGENISDKNVNYSELTALYWMWKNRLASQEIYEVSNSYESYEEYYGLSHYRRILELSEDDILRLQSNKVDVVLPYPMSYEPNIEEHHKRYLNDTDWKALLTAIEELQPEYFKAFQNILCQQYFYNYNIILARKKVLKAYCDWLFPILERIEQLSTPKGWERQDRYIGYMGETLETLYFMYNWDDLNIVHTGCRFFT